MIKTFYYNDLRTCCYIISDDSSECAIVDPGCYKESEKTRLVNYIESNSLRPKMILQTHGHFDHVMGNRFVADRWSLPTYLNSGDLAQIRRSGSYGGYFGYEFDEPSDRIIDIKDGDIIRFGNTELKVLASPGHTAGGVLFYNEKEKYVLTGDTIFKGSIGRTDLPGGDYETLMQSLRSKVLTLPDDTVIYPGHGLPTDVAFEKSTNPFLDIR